MSIHLSEDLIAFELFQSVPSLSIYEMIPENLRDEALKDLIDNKTKDEIIKEFNYNTVLFLIDIDYFDKSHYNNIAFKAIRKGYKDIVDYIIRLGADNFHEIAAYAAEGGHKDILYDMINNYDVDHFDMIAEFAAWEGHKDVVDDMIIKGADNYNDIAENAAWGGHKDIVDDMIEKGANNYNAIAQLATEEGHKELSDYIRKKYIN